MQIVQFTAGTLRFLDQVPAAAPESGFIWIYIEREDLSTQLPQLQQAAHRVGGSSFLDLHVQDLLNATHPSHYDYTSIYDLVIFRRLATEQEAGHELHEDGGVTPARNAPLAAFQRIRTRAVAFAVFDRLLITVHPAGCLTAKSFIQRYLGDAVQTEGAALISRSRLPASPADLMLRMINTMVDSYLELRKDLSAEMDQWQKHLLRPGSQGANWNELLVARAQLHTLEDLCEEQNDAMQEWLDTAREQPSPALSQSERDGLIARARDVIEHIQRVVHHVRRIEQAAETAVQIHFSAQSHRTNDIMRTLTALTAVFLPLNLVTGIFGMNFEFMPLIKLPLGFLITLGVMATIAATLALVFWRKQYLARTAR
ncbi:magnesium transporter CorA family protein [Caenimonas sp. SL110]|uniref:magnesium transporter CorA family protein n=1 Tax=Caenimonas sp. SL110 TaxID=1450524 RepID=UPI000653EEA4|nr:magnesium transporter CorA family protein [Caenimonas sp. SL110]